MQFEELRYVCQEAAVDLVENRERPLPPTVVLPQPDRTRLLTIPELPEDDEARHAVMAAIADEEIREHGIPAWGFVAEADVSGADAVVVVYGARQHAPQITAATFGDDGTLVEFVSAEELDPEAMPFLHPLQHAADALPPLEDPAEQGGLPIFES